MPSEIFSYMDMIHPMGLSPKAPAPIQLETITCPDGVKFTHPKGTTYFMDPCRGHYCPQVKAPKCRIDQMLRTTYGPAPCKTPNYSCGPRR
jgi:hypothetical protein